MSTNVHPKALELRERYVALSGEGLLRSRNVAQQLGVSELELLAAGCGFERVVPLQSDFRAMLPDFKTLGEVMALTRNEDCVHERHGTYEAISTHGQAGLVLGPDIDLRIFFAHWHHGYAVSQNGRESLQFFDADGVAVHKVYRLPESSTADWEQWVAQHAAPEAKWPELKPVAVEQRQESPVDASAFRAEWLGLQDTHDFFPLLKRHDLSREGALRAAGADLAQLVPNDAVETMLEVVARDQMSIMCFVGSRGVIQIHTGPVQRLLRTGSWFNVLDPRFNLHLNTDAVARSWVVNKPTVDGWVTSLELYNEAGELIVQWFGARKPGIPERADWRELLLSLCAEPLAEARG